jgi:hypothetical protein
MPQQPFDLLQAAFWLLAVVIVFTMVVFVMTMTGCILGVWTGLRRVIFSSVNCLTHDSLSTV